jgi:hypothetical protein
LESDQHLAVNYQVSGLIFPISYGDILTHTPFAAWLATDNLDDLGFGWFGNKAMNFTLLD